MNPQLDIAMLLAATSALVGAFWAIGKVLLGQAIKQIETQFKAQEGQFAALHEAMRQQDTTARRLERELMELKVDLPRDYVRREDYTQMVATVMAKIDLLSSKIDNAVLRGRIGE